MNVRSKAPVSRLSYVCPQCGAAATVVPVGGQNIVMVPHGEDCARAARLAARRALWAAAAGA